MAIFKGVNSLQEYEAMPSSYFILSDNVETTYSTKGMVKTFDDFSNKYKKGSCQYNGNGIKITFTDNTTTNTCFFKYKYIDYQYLFDSTKPLKINDQEYFFDNENDKKQMVDFICEYNQFMTRIFDEVIDKCMMYTILCFDNPMDSLQSFLDGLPEDVFTNKTVYCTLLHYFTLRDAIVGKLVNFTSDERS